MDFVVVGTRERICGLSFKIVNVGKETYESVVESVVPVLVRVTKDRTNYLLSFVPQRDSGDHRWVGIVFM